MPENGLTTRQSASGLSPIQFAGFSFLIVLAGAIYGLVNFIQGQNDRTAAEARARESLDNKVTQIQNVINQMGPRVELVIGLQSGFTRIEASLPPIQQKVTELDRSTVTLQSSTTGLQKDIDSLNSRLTAVQADVIRGREAAAIDRNQLRDYMMRLMQRNGAMSDPLPDRLNQKQEMPQRIDRNMDADFRIRRQEPQTLRHTRQILRALSMGEPQWRASAWLIGRCASN